MVMEGWMVGVDGLQVKSLEKKKRRAVCEDFGGLCSRSVTALRENLLSY